MKKIKLLSLFVFLISNFVSNAAVHTVSNDPGSPAQFTDVATAINNATAGDTIYVQGSAISYGISLNKQLALIGPGANPNKQNNMPATIYLDLAGSSGSNASGSTIEGFIINDVNVSFFGNSSLTFMRNKFTQSGLLMNYIYSTYNFIFRNNIFINAGVSVGNNYGYIVENNIFSCNNPINGGSHSAIINHNLFLGDGYNGNWFLSVSNSTISNNIFYGVVPSQYTGNCTFYNNISYGSLNDNFLSGSGSAGSGNFLQQDPAFDGPPVQGLFAYNYSYKLSSGSPGHNAATDGTDIGIYGGSYPMPDLTGSANIPQVTQMNVINPSVPSGGTLNVQVKAKTHK